MKQLIGKQKKFRVLAFGAASLTVAFLAVACGGSDSGGDPNPDRGLGGADTGTGGNGTGGDTSNACDSREPEVLTFDQVFWSGGFKVTLGEGQYVAATAECPQGGLAIDAKLENRSAVDGSFGERVILTSGGHDYTDAFLEADTVLGDRLGNGTIHVDVDADFSLEDATLLIGDAGKHQAIIPLGDKSTESFVSLEPTDFSVPESFQSTDLEFTMTEAFIRADYPSDHANLSDDTYQIKLTFDVTGLNGSQNVMDDGFSLGLPDGTTIPVTSDTYVNEIVAEGETYKDAVLIFEVPAPAAGAYKLYGKSHSASDVEGTLEFDIPAIPALGE